MFFRRDNNVIPGNDKPLINNIVILKPRSKSTLQLAQLRAIYAQTNSTKTYMIILPVPQIMVRNVSNPDVFYCVLLSQF